MRRYIVASRLPVVLGVAVLCIPVLVGLPGNEKSAFAQDGLPTWDDVQAAKANEVAAGQKIDEIKGLIEKNQQEMERLQAEADKANESAITAQQQLTDVSNKLKSLREQSEKNKENAAKKSKEVAVTISRIYRSDGFDRDLDLFFNSDSKHADNLLEQMAVMQKSAERNSKISKEALAAANSAASLSEQTKTAEDERKRLSKLAADEADKAARNVDAMRDQQIKTEQNRKVLEAQLAALQDKTSQTVAGYQERLRIEEEKRKAAEEAARKAAEEAAMQRAAATSSSNEASAVPASGFSGGSVAAGPSGWGRPLDSYEITCPWRCYSEHSGIDLAAPSWTPIHAAASGTVLHAGWLSTWGIYVRIQHPNGLWSAYAHMVQLPNVQRGDWVEQGQIIGYVGSTGRSTGPHLHFEIWEDGERINPSPVMANFGVPLE